MKVIKRDGRLQDFELGKIILTLEKASDELKNPFTKSDVNNISTQIQKKVMSRNEDKIRVEEIQEIVISQLMEDGFHNVAKHYEEYKNNFLK